MARQSTIAREDQPSVGMTFFEYACRNRSIIGDVLSHDHTVFGLGGREEHGIRLTAQVRARGRRDDIVTEPAELQRDLGWPHLIKEQFHSGNDCSCRQAASARAASSSTFWIQALISSG